MSPQTSRPESEREEAAGWFARLNKHRISIAELAEFQAWRRTPGHAEAYRDIEGVWKQAGVLAGDPDLLREVQAARARGFKARARRGVVWAGGATLAATTAGAALLVTGIWDLSPSYGTRVGETRIVALPDGGRVRLDTNSRIAVRYTANERRIDLLKGQALFEVAHDARRPMRVDAGGAVVHDLGTRFDIRRDRATVRIVLVEGAVRVSEKATGFASAGPTWTLEPGQELVVGQSGGPPRRVDVDRTLHWTTGQLDFDGITLGQAAAEMNRYATSKVIIDAGAIGQVRVSGVFDATDTGAFIAAVSKLYDLKAVHRADGAVVLTAPNHSTTSS